MIVLTLDSIVPIIDLNTRFGEIVSIKYFLPICHFFMLACHVLYKMLNYSY